MKKSFMLFRGTALYKLGFLPLLLTFLFLAFSQGNMNAQQATTTGSVQPASNSSNPKSLYQVPAGPFVTIPVAIDRLETAIKNLKTSMSQYAEGTAPYEAANRRYKYFSAILEGLQTGRGVAESITAGIATVISDVHDPATPADGVVERNAAVNLLRP